MLKRISFMIPVLLFLIGTHVFAHSNLKDSNPKDGAVVMEALKNITLSFETKVEATSTLTLKHQNGTDIPLSQVSVNDDTLVGTLKDDLANGGYTIHWKIIGADGHPLEGDIAFSVQLPESQAASETAIASATATSTTADTSEKVETAAVLTEKTEPEKISFKDYAIPLVVGLLIVFGVSSYWLFYRRKHV